MRSFTWCPIEQKCNPSDSGTDWTYIFCITTHVSVFFFSLFLVRHSTWTTQNCYIVHFIEWINGGVMWCCYNVVKWEQKTNGRKRNEFCCNGKLFQLSKSVHSKGGMINARVYKRVENSIWHSTGIRHVVGQRIKLQHTLQQINIDSGNHNKTFLSKNKNKIEESMNIVFHEATRTIIFIFFSILFTNEKLFRRS